MAHKASTRLPAPTRLPPLHAPLPAPDGVVPTVPVFWRSGTIWLEIGILAQGLNLGGLGVALGNLRVPCGMASYSARIRDSFSERSGLPEDAAARAETSRPSPWLPRASLTMGDVWCLPRDGAFGSTRRNRPRAHADVLAETSRPSPGLTRASLMMGDVRGLPPRRGVRVYPKKPTPRPCCCAG